MIRSQIVLHANGVRCEPGPGEVPSARAPDVPQLHDAGRLRLRRAWLRELVVQDNTFDVLGADHHTLAKVEITERRTQQFAFAADTRQARFTIQRRRGCRALRRAASCCSGIEHILTGYDHLLFLLGLLLPGRKLACAGQDHHGVHAGPQRDAGPGRARTSSVLPDRLVEAVIALSIAFVAAENIFLEAGGLERDWVVSFCFGLVHGFGFSSALRELGLPTHGLALALFGFNAGRRSSGRGWSSPWRCRCWR